MNTAVSIVNIVLAMFVLAVVVGLLAWNITRDQITDLRRFHIDHS